MSPILFREVLIIDDDKASRYLSGFLLSTMNIAEKVVLLPDAQVALKHIKEYCANEHAANEDRPDLILLDVNMHYMDGFDFLEDFKTLSLENRVCVTLALVSTSYSPRDREKAGLYGVSVLLEKPLDEDKIISLAAKAC